jgi:ubiquinone/menaquinone biosynthesis C-methylase UbiE
MITMEKKHHIDYLLEQIPNLLELSILDLGSGRGGFLIDIACRRGRAVGLEINDAYINETLDNARKKNLQVKIIKGAAENLPFDNAIFDFVNFALVIEHVDDPNRAIKEIARVLKIGGQAYMGLPNRYGFKDPHFHLYFVNWLPRFLCNHFITLFGRHKDYNGSACRQNLADMHYYTFNQIKEVLVKEGFEMTDIREGKIKNYFKNSFFPPPLIFLYRIHRFFFSDSFHLLLKKMR